MIYQGDKLNEPYDQWCCYFEWSQKTGPRWIVFGLYTYDRGLGGGGFVNFEMGYPGFEDLIYIEVTR